MQRETKLQVIFGLLFGIIHGLLFGIPQFFMGSTSFALFMVLLWFIAYLWPVWLSEQKRWFFRGILYTNAALASGSIGFVIVFVPLYWLAHS